MGTHTSTCTGQDLQVFVGIYFVTWICTDLPRWVIWIHGSLTQRFLGRLGLWVPVITLPIPDSNNSLVSQNCNLFAHNSTLWSIIDWTAQNWDGYRLACLLGTEHPFILHKSYRWCNGKCCGIVCFEERQIKEYT